MESSFEKKSANYEVVWHFLDNKRKCPMKYKVALFTLCSLPPLQLRISLLNTDVYLTPTVRTVLGRVFTAVLCCAVDIGRRASE